MLHDRHPGAVYDLHGADRVRDEAPPLEAVESPRKELLVSECDSESVVVIQ
jgi:hypothetical protein